MDVNVILGRDGPDPRQIRLPNHHSLSCSNGVNAAATLPRPRVKPPLVSTSGATAPSVARADSDVLFDGLLVAPVVRKFRVGVPGFSEPWAIT